MNTVFIADDNNTDRMILENALRKIGFSTKTFDSGLSIFRAIFESDSPVVALLDWVMPDKSGVDICRTLITSPPQQPVYAIVITSRTEKADIAYALENGADDYVAKPFDIPELGARIKTGFRLINAKRQLMDNNARLIEYARRLEGIADERTEQLTRADRLSTIGILSAGIAHEINNPCSFISVNLQTLEENMPPIIRALDKDPSEEDRDAAKKITALYPEIFREMKNGITRIRSIVNGLKTYVHPVRCDHNSGFCVEPCIDSALHLCENRLKYTVTVKKEYSDTPEVFGDQTEIEQVFINLFTNAADAIEERGSKGTLTITTACEDNNVIIHIRDSGPGIPEDMINHMFLPFHTKKPAGKGTGLGLYISRNIMKSNRGDIQVKNRPEGGACFTLRLSVQKKGAA